MDNKIFKELIEQRVSQPVEHVMIKGLWIEAFTWSDYSLTIHSVCNSDMVCIYLFKDAEELAYIELPLTRKTDRKAIFNMLVVPNVPQFFDDVVANDNADNGYIGNGTWFVKVLPAAPFEQFDVVTGSIYLHDTMEELDNQDLGDFVGLEQFSNDLDELDMDFLDDVVEAQREWDALIGETFFRTY